MAKMYFYYGVMGSSKTAQALMTKFNYEEKGKKVLLLKPETDTRDNFTDEQGRLHYAVKSRIGLSAEAIPISSNDNIVNVIKYYFRIIDNGFPSDRLLDSMPHIKVSCINDIIIVDEAQFLTAKQVEGLRSLVNDYDITVICYGLRTDFQTHLFEGSKRLLELADTITEVKSMCACGNKATVSARIGFNGKIITDGEQIDIGGNDKYVGMCHRCYIKGIGEANG